jgi:hypothetical protein
MFKWINPVHWGKRAAHAVKRWENRRKAEQFFQQADLMVIEADSHREGPVKDACMKKALEFANKAFALSDK